MPVAFNLDDYTPVSERIKQFWADHPNGAIHSELVYDDDALFAKIGMSYMSKRFYTYLDLRVK